MATSALSMSASAATKVEWGDNFFTPNSGSFYASNTQVFVKDLKWSTKNIAGVVRQQRAMSSVRWGFYAAEFEFRPVGTSAPSVWQKALDLYSNLPEYYSEPAEGEAVTDPNDVSIGCRKLAECDSGQTYYGYLSLAPTNSAPQSGTFVFETEYDWHVPLASDISGDTFPLQYAPYPTETQFGTVTNWSY